MRRFLNNWSTALELDLLAGALSMTVPVAAAAQLPALAEGEVMVLTISTAGASESAWEIVSVTGVAGGVISIERGQEDTNDQSWPAGSVVSARVTAGGLEAMQDIELPATAQTGDAVESLQSPGAGWLPQSGQVLDAATYPALAAVAPELGNLEVEQVIAPLTTYNLYGVASNGTRFIALTSNSQLVISDDDGLTWALSAPAGVSFSCSGIKYLAGQFILFGSSGGLATSPDGDTWTTRSLGHSYSVTDVEEAAGVLVSSASSGRIARSTDSGVSWTVVSTSGSAISKLTYAGTRWLGCIYGGVRVSDDDGATWTDISSGFSYTFIGIVRAGSSLLMATAGILIRSNDNGATWTQITPPNTFVQQLLQLPGDVALLCRTGSATCHLSSDGSAFTPTPTPTGAIAMSALAVGGTTWVASGGTGRIARSADSGATWVQVLGQITTTPSKFAHGAGVVVAPVGAGTVAVSDDGADWQFVEIGDDSIADIIWDGARFVAVTTSSSIAAVLATLTSADGLTWSRITLTGVTGTPRSITWDGTYYYLLAGSNVYRSSNLSAWTLVLTGLLDYSSSAVLCVGGSVVALSGSAGRVYVSTDAGGTWAELYGPAIRGASGNESLLLVGTTANKLRVTADGFNWTELPFPAPSNSSRATVLPNGQLAVDEWLSANGRDWAASYLPASSVSTSSFYSTAHGQLGRRLLIGYDTQLLVMAPRHSTDQFVMPPLKLGSYLKL
jgi:hypothetical protein